MTEWNIQSRARACAACGKSFADQEAYHTLLTEERTELLRRDICQACWVKEYGEGGRDRKGFVSYWHGVYEAPAPVTDPIQKETAESLLRKLIARDDPHYVPAAFILAVMLERKRLLKIREQLVREGRRVFIYELPKTGDVFTIIDPNLQLNHIEDVQRDVANLLEHGLAAVSESPAPPRAGPLEGATPPAVPAGAPDPAPPPAEPSRPTAPGATSGLESP